MENLYIILFTFFIVIYSKIKDNPIFLVNGGYPIVLSTEDDDYYYVITENIDLKIEKESGEIVETNNTIKTEISGLYIIDNSNHKNYIIFELEECFLIKYNPFSTYKLNPINSLKSLNDHQEVKKIGSIVQDNDFIIYGFFDQELFFSSKSQQNHSQIHKEQINDKLSCKYIDGEDFVCAMAV